MGRALACKSEDGGIKTIKSNHPCWVLKQDAIFPRKKYNGTIHVCIYVMSHKDILYVQRLKTLLELAWFKMQGNYV